MSKTLRQHITITGTLVNTRYSSNIFLNFIPDEVIVRELAYMPNDDTNGIVILYTDLLSNDKNILGVVPYNRLDASNILYNPVTCSNAIFNLPNFSNNSLFNFYSNGPDGVIFIHLEFVKHM